LGYFYQRTVIAAEAASIEFQYGEKKYAERERERERY